ncbi:MAG: tandem-95 repeat protein, partial [Candidatus Thiodiazotropha sp. (ex Epidulcina cf. delphinae)]|nr:tandem-95 repeat protein [Candidatus Thiodiazotropha sp. (ex Epidulcina cf. delphinae)]
MSFKRYLQQVTFALFAVFAALTTAEAAPSPVAADVIVVIDESGSMSGEQRWVAEVIPLLEQDLLAYGIGNESQANQYGLVGYTRRPRSFLLDGELLGDDQAFAASSGGLRTSGGTEDGWRAIKYALRRYPRRNGAAVNIILATDEDRDNTKSAITFQKILTKLEDNNALLNAVVNARIQCGDGSPALGMDSSGIGYVADGSGGFSTCEGATATTGSGSTIAHYVELAVQNGGAVWDLRFLRSGGYYAESFTNALLTVKVDEILNQRPIGDLVAVAQATPNPAVAGRSVMLDGAQSFHQLDNRRIVAWEWDLDNDGVYDISGPVVTTSFPRIGRYPIALRVTDDSDTPVVDVAEITVDINIPPLQPTAVSGGPYLFCPQNTPWRLDGGRSVNPDDGMNEPGSPQDAILDYAWDLNNDLHYNDANGAVVDVTSQMQALGVGDHLIRLRVTDNTVNAFPGSGLDHLSDISVSQVSVRDQSDILCNCLPDLAARPKAAKVRLTWTDTGVYQYAVYRSQTEGGPYHETAVTDNRYSTYSDPGLEPDTTYYYVVAERGANGRDICRSREVAAIPVSERNVAPVITIVSLPAATEDVGYAATVEATDSNAGDTISYSIESGPSGLAIDAATGQMSWLPLNDHVGDNSVVVRATDTGGLFSEATLTIAVLGVNDTPSITSAPITTAQSQTAYQYQVAAQDADAGDTLTFALQQGPQGMTISATGLVEWLPPSNAAAAYPVKISVTDSAGASVNQSYTLTVTNRDPQITSTPVAHVVEGGNYQYQIIAGDADGDALSYSLTTAPAGMTIDGTGGLITWTPGSAQLGTHTVSVQVDDGRGGTAGQNFTLTVDPAPNTAPIITGAPVTTATEGVAYSYDVDATDADGDTLSYSLTTAPAGMTIDSAGGLIAWTPATAQVGGHPVSVQVDDGNGGTATQGYTVTVAAAPNAAPAITSTPVTSVNENSPYRYKVAATDPDANDQLTYRLTAAPAGVGIDSVTGLIEWSPTAVDIGEYAVTVVVADPAGLTDSQSFTLQVVDADDPPSAADIAVTTEEDLDLSIVLQGHDIDGDAITYSIVTQPLNGRLSGVAPNLAYTPNADFNGSDSFTYQADDGLLDSNIATVSITVSSVNDTPTISSSPITTGEEDTPYQYPVEVSDPDSSAFTYALTTAPVGMSIDANGLIGWTPDYSAAGDHPVAVSVHDTLGAGDTQAFTLSIADTNRVPVLEPIIDVTLEENTTLTIAVNASDADGDALTYSVAGLPGFANHTDSTIDLSPGNNDAGTFGPVVVTISDGVDSRSVGFNITVTQGNHAPVITSTPTAFVIEGDEWRYTLEANDPDGDDLTYAMTQAPSGAVFDPATYQVVWPTTGVAPGNYAIQFSVSDTEALTTEQSVTIEVLPAERKTTHEGTEFWLPVTLNHVRVSNPGTFDINLVSNGVDTEATIEIPALGVVENLSLTADQMATYSINLEEFAETEGYALSRVLEDYGIHITAASPVAVYLMNQKASSTDGFLGLPVASLGREYIVATYIMLGKLGMMSTVDGGQLGPIITVVATEDNTQVTIDPVMDIFPGGQQQIEADTPIEITMNRGDVYNLETRGSYKADLTGSMVRADKPVGVFGQMSTTNIPVGVAASDHIVEQMPPIESLATEYYTAPFWGRTEHGREWYVEYGDRFRAVAPYDNTAVYVDDVLRARLNRGEYFEFAAIHAQHVKAGQPILLVQYSNGNQIDDGYRELQSQYTDPFMVVVPPAEQFLNRYTINTPARDLAYNFVNLLVPTSTLSTLMVDGQSVDQSLFNEIPNNPFSYSQYSISPGSHHIEAQEPFGAYVYGYDYYESYGYLGGMALSVGGSTTSLTLTGEATQTLDHQWCAESTIVDRRGVPVNGARIRFNLAGVTNHDAYRFSDAHGIARYCYRANKPGIDTVTATVNQLSRSVSIDWLAGTQNRAPVISSLPGLGVVNGESYAYDVQVEDPEGGALLYTLIEAPNGMSISESGHLAWPQVYLNAAKYNREKVVLSVTDPLGLEAVQSFELSNRVAFNTPPEFGEATVSLTATQGVPYVYNLDQVQGHLDYLKYQVLVTDSDKDAAFVDILSGPDEAYIQRIQSYYTSITRENEPRSCVNCTHYFRWIPQAVGEQSFELGLRDARGASVESRSFTVNVAPNLPPQIVDFNPHGIASVDHPYSYMLNVENDVPPHTYANLDDLKVVFEQAPLKMRYDLTGVNGGTQKLRIYWTPGYRDVGLHTIRLRVDDRLHSSATEEFTINVVDDNQPPVIAAGGIPSAEVSIPYEYRINASDPDGDALTYRLATAPEGMTVNETTGVINWTPSDRYSNANVWVRCVVTDAQGLTAEINAGVGVVAFSNRWPEFIPTYRPNYAKVGRAYVHQALAVDREGDNPLTYWLRMAPPGATIDSQNGTITWTPTETGRFQIVAAVADSLGNYSSSESSVLWDVQAVPDTEPLDAELQLSPSQVIDLGESVTLSVIPGNSATTPQASLIVDGEAADLDALLEATVTPARVGRIPVTVTVNDGYETVRRTTHIVVRDPSDQVPPVVEIVAPAPSSTVTALIDIVGTAQDDNLTEVFLAYKRADQDDAEYIELYRGSRIFDSEIIAGFDPGLLLNGTYHILLQATDSNNNVMGRRVSVFLDGDLKVGNFSFTVEDLELSLAGIPITVSRTYDSRRRSENLDFGHGWTVDYQNVRLEESQEPTQGWRQALSPNEIFQAGPGHFSARATCIYPVTEKTVSITLPNNDIEKFRVVARPSNGLESAVSNPNCYLSTDRIYDLFFEAVDGARSTLEASSARSLYLTGLDNGYLAYAGDGQALPITNYTLTTRTGYVYRLNQDFGVEQITDPNGHTLSYADTGITHSSGKSVTFNRDGNGRIAGVTDPAGNRIVYGYSPGGDLITVTDRNQAVSTYAYNNSHGLLDMLDPLGRRLIRNIYDDEGRLTAQEDSQGNRTTFSHDLGANQSVVTNRRGFSTQYGYDERGNVTTQVDALNHITTYTFDAHDNQLSKTDALGHVSTATYNANDDQLTQTDPLGHTVSYAYNDRGQETTVTTAGGDVFTNSYDAVGNLLSIEDPLGHTASNTLNSLGQVTRTTDALGNVTSYTYDGNGYKATETDALGAVTTYTHDANGNVLTESRTRTLADNSRVTETTTYVYDTLDRVIRTTDALGQVTSSEYDPAGNQVATLDALGRRTEMDYDAYGRLIETRYPDGGSETQAYDPEGNRLTETDRQGRTTSYAYDALNRQIQVTYPDGSVTQTEYNELGQVSAEIDARGNRTEYAYDAAGRRIATTDAQGNEHRFEYDADGNLTAEIDALNHRTEYIYNALDQRISVVYHDNSNQNDSYDALARRTEQSDPAGVSTQYAYDAPGRLSQVTDALGGITSYSYDEQGNKLTQTDAEGRTTSWTYDALGRALSRTLPIGQSEHFSYDANGNLSVHTDFDGRTTSHQYDSDNRLTRSDYADGRIERFSYDAAGNRTQTLVTRPDGGSETTSYAYDPRDRLSRKTQSDGATLDYRYDAAGNRTQVRVTQPDNSTRTTDYAYDSLNRLESATDATGITSYGYDAVGNRSSISYPNGSSEVYRYDSLNRLTRKETYNGDGALIQAYDYTLHATGRRTGIDEQSGRSTAYGYDDLYRLTSESITDSQNGNYSAGYQYDAVGNRTYSTIDGVQTAYTYDDNDRLTRQGGTRYTYDNNGNTLSESLDTTTTTYSYNAKNELISVERGGNTTEYRYNPNGIRNAKTEGGVTTSYTVDENRDYAQVLIEDNGTSPVSYTYGDDLISQTRDGATSFYHYDGLGSTRSLTDSLGNLTDTYDYEAFGEVLNRTGTTENGYLFAGEQFDSESGNYYLRNRYMNPENGGRFLT